LRAVGHSPVSFRTVVQMHAVTIVRAVWKAARPNDMPLAVRWRFDGRPKTFRWN
jgi:hypothetical protein